MNPRARTPEELDTLLEDAFVLRDPGALASLFEARALLVAGDGAGEVRGSEEIALLAPVLWSGDFTYLADPRRVAQAQDIALVLATHGTSVVRRGPDGAWRYAISLLAIDQQTERRTLPPPSEEEPDWEHVAAVAKANGSNSSRERAWRPRRIDDEPIR